MITALGAQVVPSRPRAGPAVQRNATLLYPDSIPFLLSTVPRSPYIAFSHSSTIRLIGEAACDGETIVVVSHEANIAAKEDAYVQSPRHPQVATFVIAGLLGMMAGWVPNCRAQAEPTSP